MTGEPRIVTWSDHALVKADLMGVSRTDMEDAIIAGHPWRARNARAADWLLAAGRLMIAYNCHDGDEEAAAHVVTVWRGR